MKRDHMNFKQISVQMLLAGYQNGQYKIHEVTQSIINRIRETQPRLNALVEDRFEEALNEAREKQVLLEQNRVDLNQYPLWGLPVTIKEMIAVKGMRQTLGTLDRKDWISQFDATLVTRLRERGAIILGTTNVSELGFWFECSNPVYGATCNPLNPDYSSGGSSGGEGALVGAGITPIGFGSDIGGSIRIPASFCGCLGYKPTPGVLPVTGHFPALPEFWEQWIRSPHMTSLGFLSHHLGDMIFMTQLLSGSDHKDPTSNMEPLNWDPVSDDITIYLLDNPDFNGAFLSDPEVTQAIQNVGKYLEAIGLNVVKLKDNCFENSLKLWLHRASQESVDDFFKLLSPIKNRSIFNELGLKILGKNQFGWPALLTAVLEKVAPAPQVSQNEFQSQKDQIHQLLGNNSVIVLPTHPRSGIKHNQSLTRPFDFIFTATANLYDLPALQVPVAKSSKTGLPIGCQIWAAPKQDRLIFHVGEILNSAFNQNLG